MPKKKKRNTGLPPGSVVFTGQRKVEKISIHYLEYSRERCEAKQLDNQSIQDFHQPVSDFVQWYDIRGLHDTELIGAFGKVFAFHPLAMEDIADTNQRAKMDAYEDGIFIAIKALSFDSKTFRVMQEQVSIYLGDGFLITFQEDEADLFSGIRQRIELSGGRIRQSGADYLLYALLDYLVDEYFVVLDAVEQALETMESRIYGGQSPVIRNELYDFKQEVNRLRKMILPNRELFNRLAGENESLLTPTTLVYLQDLRDHQIQSIELADSYRDAMIGLQELYLSELSFRMNNVMQFLAIVSTILIPLTFLTGLYGMNFAYIPGINNPNGFWILVVVMAGLTLGLVLYFRRKRWL